MRRCKSYSPYRYRHSSHVIWRNVWDIINFHSQIPLIPCQSFLDICYQLCGGIHRRIINRLLPDAGQSVDG